MINCIDCDDRIMITRDHREYAACGLMKPHYDYLVDWVNTDVPAWCPKLKRYRVSCPVHGLWSTTCSIDKKPVCPICGAPLSYDKTDQ